MRLTVLGPHALLGSLSMFDTGRGRLPRLNELHVRFWPKADIRSCAALSAFGGKADIDEAKWYAEKIDFEVV